MYVRSNRSNRLSGLGVAPFIAAGATGFVKGIASKIFGSGPPQSPFPWRWDKPGHEVGYTGPDAPPGVFGIVFGTNHQWWRVWSGTVDEVFGRPGFDISGSIDGGKRKWRARVIGDKLQLTEDFGKGPVPTFSGTEQQLKSWTNWSPAPFQPSFTDPRDTVPSNSATVIGSSSSSIGMLIAGALVGLYFLFKR